MTDTSTKKLLYIEPKKQKASSPLVDDLSRKMRLLLSYAKSGLRYRGFHICKCGEFSDNTDWTLPDGTKTNSLCVHYLEHHRDEVPECEIVKLRNMELPK